MKTRIILVIIFIACLSSRLDAYQKLEISEAVKTSIIERVDGKYNTGIVVGIIDDQGTDFFCYGKAEIGRDEKVTKTSIFEIGSISKVFTAVLLSTMIKKGEVKIDDPIGKYLPESLKLPSGKNKDITLRHLVTHTSSLPRMPDNFNPSDPRNPYLDYTVENMYEFLSGYTLKRAVGSQYEYSNLGTGLLGHLLSLKAKLSYNDLVTERILKKLDMNSTYANKNPELDKRLVKGHSLGRIVPVWIIPTLAGAGAIRSSAVDMVKFLAANLGFQKTELTEEISKTHPGQFDISSQMKIGLGWHIQTSGEEEIIWHNGGTGGFRAFCGFNKEKSTGVVVLTNSNVSCDDIGFHLLDNTTELKKTKQEVIANDELLIKYCGKYELAPTFHLNVTKSGTSLFVQATGQDKYQVFPQSQNEFFYKVVEASITFKSDDSGKVTNLVLHQNGRDLTGKRLPEKKEVKVSSSILSRYAGEYEVPGRKGKVFKISLKNGTLMIAPPDTPAAPMKASSDTEFLIEAANARVTMNLDEQGSVVSLTLIRNGNPLTMRKIK